MPTRLRELILPLAGILLLAINLRPAITAVGPVINKVGSGLALTAFELGLLGALPIATFGVVSGFVQFFIGRFELERVTAAAMVILAGATLLRSWPGPDANLWAGTILIGAAIAVGNVAVPVFVKRSFPARTAAITAIYVAVLGVCAGLAAALAVPIADASRWGWRLALGVWAILTAAAVVYWCVQAVRAHADAGSSSVPLSTAPVKLRRSPVAWQLSVYMGVQSSVFYVSLTWLPTVEQSLGFSAVVAGLHMFALQVAGVAGNLLAPVFMRFGPDERFAAVLPGVLFVVAVTGLYWLPAAALAWIMVLGLGTGMAFVVSLSLIATRAFSVATAGRLSAMSQGVGYLIAAIVLFIAGSIAGLHPSGVLAVLLSCGLLVAFAGLLAGRGRII